MPQSHHTRRLEYALTASGVSAPFFFRSHWTASRGCSEARSLNPDRTFCPAQNGQPAFDVTRAGNARLPAMSFRAPPPDLPVCSRHDLRRQQRGILFCVPVRKQIREFCRQRVFLRQNDAASADGTARPLRAAFNCRAVRMPFSASPPYKPSAANRQLRELQRAILLCIPFRLKLWIAHSQGLLWLCQTS